MADFELVTGDNEVSSIDSAEFVDLRTVRTTIADLRTLMEAERAKKDAANAEIQNLNYDLSVTAGKKAEQVAIRAAANDKIAELLPIITELREMAADLKLKSEV